MGSSPLATPLDLFAPPRLAGFLLEACKLQREGQPDELHCGEVYLAPPNDTDFDLHIM